MFVLSMACFVIRVYGYTMLTPSTKWWILALESIHGVTFATFWIVTTDVSKVLIDQNNNSSGGRNGKGKYDWSTTVPSVIQMLYTAVGATIGSVFGGYAMHQVGSKLMYLYTAEIICGLLLIHSFGSILARTTYHNQLESLLPHCRNNEVSVDNNADVTNIDDVLVDSEHHDHENRDNGLSTSDNQSTTHS